MKKIDWETQLAQRHQAPPPAPADEWRVVQARIQAPQPRPRWSLALGGGLAMAGLLAVLLLPRGPQVKPATPEEESLATEQWVQQQWGSTNETALAEDQIAEPDADLLDLLDKV